MRQNLQYNLIKIFAYFTDMAVRGAFFNCGQNCISAERFFIYEPIYDKFVNEVVKTAKNVRQLFPI
jgi:acyl-CoA reductase-like NAD-dependent aldehyde dehydrogenase